VITAALRKHPEIKAVLCTGQADTEGAGLAVEKEFANQGYFVGGFDLSPQTLRLLKAGVIQFTIDQQPYVQGFYPVVQLTLCRRYGIRPANLDAGATILRPSDADAVLELTRRGYR
jgi:simple sugar transport system substrate-binding protein